MHRSETSKYQIIMLGIAVQGSLNLVESDIEGIKGESLHDFSGFVKYDTNITTTDLTMHSNGLSVYTWLTGGKDFLQNYIYRN